MVVVKVLEPAVLVPRDFGHGRRFFVEDAGDGNQLATDEGIDR